MGNSEIHSAVDKVGSRRQLVVECQERGKSFIVFVVLHEERNQRGMKGGAVEIRENVRTAVPNRSSRSRHPRNLGKREVLSRRSSGTPAEKGRARVLSNPESLDQFAELSRRI